MLEQEVNWKVTENKKIIEYTTTLKVIFKVVFCFYKFNNVISFREKNNLFEQLVFTQLLSGSS